MIALVISIIVMLILAGVSINAVIGDNGILTRTQYASFLNEMAAVEEAVQLWKTGEVIEANGENTKLIPANGLCKANELTETERLVGEVGYYRIWSMSETQPTTNILSDASDFNSAFESELIFYPAGVQDLYYLNNEALGIKEDKTYLIDASTGMIYSMTGIGLKGVRCYSSSMAKAVMNGESTAPLFAEAEVSGTGSGDKLAGNVQDELLPDGTPNPDYNPYGFQIIASQSCDNIYKLYNNGDLYGKGVKGILLNTPEDEMTEINRAWDEVPEPNISQLNNYSKKIQGFAAIYYIDDSGNLWALGTNPNNRFGLTTDQLNEYTGREFIKLNINNEKVYDVLDSRGSRLYVITQNGELYVCGQGGYGAGVGITALEINTFTKVDLMGKDARDIEWIREANTSVIKFKDGTYMASGDHGRGLVGDGVNAIYEKFCPIWNGYAYKKQGDGSYVEDISVGYKADLDIDSKIKEALCISTYLDSWLLLYEDGTIYFQGAQRFDFKEGFSNYKLQKFNSNFAKNIMEIFSIQEGFILKNSSDDIFFMGNGGIINSLEGTEEKSNSMIKLIIPEELKQIGIKEYLIGTSAIYFLSNNNELWGIGTSKVLGDDFNVIGIHKLNAPKMKEIRNSTYQYNKDVSNSAWSHKFLIFHGMDNKYYGINDSNILKGDKILQKNWTKLTDIKVESMSVSGNFIGVIEKETHNLYVAGNDSRVLNQKTEEQFKIPNLIKLDDSLINGKCKTVKFGDSQMYILTTEGLLYGTGIVKKYSAWRKRKCL